MAVISFEIIAALLSVYLLELIHQTLKATFPSNCPGLFHRYSNTVSGFHLCWMKVENGR